MGTKENSMLHEFLVFIIDKMDRKGETFSADHSMTLLTLVTGKSNDEGLSILEQHSQTLSERMKEASGDSVEHGKLWSMKLDVEQAIKGGRGELIW